MKKTLNRDLFDDPKDAIIADLHLCIKRFKKYDKQRKHYIEHLLGIIADQQKQLEQYQKGKEQ